MPQSLKSLIANYVTLTDSEWDLLISKFKRIAVKKNDFLIKEGQISNSVYFIDKGRMRMYYLKDGIETTRYFAVEGQFAAALSSFISRTPTVENIQSIEPCDLLQVNYDDFHLLCNTIPAWKDLYLKMMQLAYVNTTLRIEGLITKNCGRTLHTIPEG